MTKPASPRPPAFLRTQNVSITHTGSTVPALDAVSFEIARGEVVLLLGPSGSGKSTLTLALNGLIPHEVPATLTGTVTVDGHDTARTPVATLSTRVGMVFQDPDAQLVTGSVFDEVAFGPENLCLPVAEIDDRVEAALRQVGLWHSRGASPDTLSGGARQRLAIACALALRSPLLVLDEPTANLDPQGTEDVFSALEDLIDTGEHAIVLVEHNLDAALRIATRVIVLDAGGAVLADGTVAEVVRQRADQLHAAGVWLPVSTLAALRLRAAGYRIDPLPVTPAELRGALGSLPPPPAQPTRGAERVRDADPVLTARGLSLRRGGAAVLHDVSLDLCPGELVAIIGGNGAGKTSLIQALAGVITPPRGTVFLQGQDVSRLPASEVTSRVGFVFQNPEHQFITHTVADELGYSLHHLNREQAAERTADILSRFGLAGKEATHPFRLSGGQKRRLSVATALVTGAPILVLDEPTFGQDRARADELLHLLVQLRDAGTTVVIVTHDLQLVAEHADRVLGLREGRIVVAGEAHRVLGDAAAMASLGLRRPYLCEAFPPTWPPVIRLADLAGGAV